MLENLGICSNIYGTVNEVQLQSVSKDKVIILYL